MQPQALHLHATQREEMDSPLSDCSFSKELKAFPEVPGRLPSACILLAKLSYTLIPSCMGERTVCAMLWQQGERIEGGNGISHVSELCFWKISTAVFSMH